MSEISTNPLRNYPLDQRHIELLSQKEQKLVSDPVHTAKRDEHAADSEIASIYYLSTLQSMKEVAQPTFTQAKQSVDIEENKKSEKGIIQTIKDWLWGFLGFAKDDPNAIEPKLQAIDNVYRLGNSPSLSPPDYLSNNLLEQSILEINQHLERLKECNEFEEEMRKSNSKKLDKMIFVQLTSHSLKQRDLKQANSIIAQQELHKRRKENEEIQQKTNVIADELVSGKSIANALKWVNVSLSGTLVLGTALAFFTGGSSALIAVAMPLASVLKGGTTLTDGIVKFNNGKKEGELMLHRENARANNGVIHDQLEEMQVRDDEIAYILKSLRKILKDQSENERSIARFGR